jgi:hypothetical protein
MHADQRVPLEASGMPCLSGGQRGARRPAIAIPAWRREGVEPEGVAVRRGWVVLDAVSGPIGEIARADPCVGHIRSSRPKLRMPAGLTAQVRPYATGSAERGGRGTAQWRRAWQICPWARVGARAHGSVVGVPESGRGSLSCFRGDGLGDPWANPSWCFAWKSNWSHICNADNPCPTCRSWRTRWRRAQPAAPPRSGRGERPGQVLLEGGSQKRPLSAEGGRNRR